ncbi:DUF6124 family protein, partial [Pseudomonas sp. A-RE-6]|uniref:DUF6124 family protein n=1 Tax=Pseudomonas sp. A-RE-6 TaxID=2832371 RepID=UPI003988FBAA
FLTRRGDKWGRRSCVGAVECNEAAIFPQPLESQVKDQKIAAFGSSYRGQPSGINSLITLVRHVALGIQQLIELAKLLANRALDDLELAESTQ